MNGIPDRQFEIFLVLLSPSLDVGGHFASSLVGVFFFSDICFVRDLAERIAVCFVLHPGPVAQKVDNGIHLIKFNPIDKVIGFHNTYPLDSDL